MTYEMSFTSNREVRRIPAGWQHPKDGQGRFIPLHAADYLQRMSADECAEVVESYRRVPLYAGRDYVMTAVEGQAEIMAYETTTEGTPCSPAFPETPEGKLALVNWCAEHVTTWADHKADAETWAAILFGGGLASVSEDGIVGC